MFKIFNGKPLIWVVNQPNYSKYTCLSIINVKIIFLFFTIGNWNSNLVIILESPQNSNSWVDFTFAFEWILNSKQIQFVTCFCSLLSYNICFTNYSSKYFFAIDLLKLIINFKNCVNVAIHIVSFELKNIYDLFVI